MERSGYVSVWIGVSPSADSLDEYLDQEYTEDGDALPSAFMQAFDIDWYDDDFREAHHIGRLSRSAADLLTGFSYDEAVISRIQERYGELLPEEANVALFLYGFEYDGRIPTGSDGKTRLHFIGAFPYREPRPQYQPQDPVKDQIVPALKQLVRDMVEGRFEEIERDGRGGRYPALKIAEALGDYPGTPSMPPDRAFIEIRDGANPRVGFRLDWPRSASPPQATVEFFLWYNEQPSDLMVQCVCTFPGGRMDKIAIWNIYVP